MRGVGSGDGPRGRVNGDRQPIEDMKAERRRADLVARPAVVEEMGLGLSEQVSGSLDRAVALVLDTVGDLLSDPALAG